ncbi:response regulator transcription factor [Thermostaphylospora chromogena]|uniref:DNA-binding response regulator, NarL/FixJ family, contains REC and HTH domains n=1 Tax=Thermostaphylospora chromogena TaxID=35622 RepID=A0A1H1BIT4_9ACTN|nr:response regulator transcription factor [Thermostaphylospora chromogena]SDQ51817.1 DNA-binding response regulator, NarL/FixJ family, contains REC and HTH domains [Thermostaphylospora chromogena]
MRVVIAEDSTLLREGLARLLVEAGFDVAATVEDGEALLAEVARHRPDVAVVDIRLPPTRTDEGLRAAREIRRGHPGTGVLVLSQYVRVSYTVELLDAGAEGVGYLLKDRVTDLEEFAAALRRVGSGGSAFDPLVIDQLVRRRAAPQDPLRDLTARERDVLALMAEGRTNQAIAARLAIAERTVEKHCTNIFAKLAIPARPDDHRRVLAVLRYLNA